MIRPVILLFMLLFHSAWISGTETCKEYNDTTPESNEAEIVDGTESHVDFRSGEDVTLYCCFVSKHPYQVKWFKDNVPLTPGSKYAFGENNQVLSFGKSNLADGGVYRCEASNKHGRQSWNITVQIHLPLCTQAPKVHTHQDKRVKKGSTVTLTCLVKTPKDCVTVLPVYYWKHRKVTVKGNITKISSNVRENIVRVRLTINKAKKRNAGTYKCIVKTQQFNVKNKVKLFVV